MLMESKTFYAKAHLFVAAVRLLEYKEASPPSLHRICNFLSISLEEGNRLCRKLKDLSAIDIIEKGDEARIFIIDHKKLEEIPVQEDISKIESELMKFKKTKEDQKKKIEMIQAEQAEKKKKLHEDLEKILKKQLKPD